MMRAFREMLTDPTTKRFSESKLWVHPAKAALIWAFVHASLHHPPSEWLWFTFGVLMLGHETASRFVSAKIVPPASKEETEEGSP